MIEIKNDFIYCNVHCVIAKQNYLKKNIMFCHALFMHEYKKENFFKKTFQLLKETIKIKIIFLNLIQSVLH